MRKRILCYGDSNTWGYMPGSGLRYENDVRWTGVLQNELGDGFKVLEEGLNGRTSCFDPGYDDILDGRATLRAVLKTQYPIDVAVVMLGTNDIDYVPFAQSLRGIKEIVRILENANGIIRGSTPIWTSEPKILLVAPMPFNPCVDAFDPYENLDAGKYGLSCQFAKYYKHIADECGVSFLDAGQYAKSSEIDGIHMDAESHLSLGKAIAAKIREMV